MPTNQIVRKYEKPETFLGLNNTGNSVTKTKAILASLGMSEDFAAVQNRNVELPEPIHYVPD